MNQIDKNNQKAMQKIRDLYKRGKLTKAQAEFLAGGVKI